MPYRRVLDVRIARFERAHDHLAGVHAHANFYRHSAGLEKLVAVAANLTLHTKRRMKRALRMVFARDGSAKQCEDTVAGTLHVAIIMAGGIDHYFQRRVDDRTGLLRIEVLLELGRALDVSEECGDRLSLAVGSTRYDFLGQHPNPRR